MAKEIVSKELLAAVEELLGLDLNTVLRVVIDIKSGHFPVIYTELIGDNEKTLNVVQAMSSVEIERG